MPEFPTPPSELTARARELANQASAERGIPIDRICIAAACDGSQLHVIELEDPYEDDADDDPDA